MASASDGTLEVANLEVVYHKVVLVLRGVSLHVPRGRIVALLGPNGAGKTTTIRAITGLLSIHDGSITKGAVRFDGGDLGAEPAERIVRRGIAQTMEGRRIFADLTVEENLLSGAFTSGRLEARRNVERFYDRFAVLRDRRHHQAGYLSGGEQQMLAIARALMSQPRLLLLDEPSLGLAPKVVHEVTELISEVNREGVSILLVEQNAAMALDLAHYGYVMEGGRIVVDGPSDELKRDEDIREFYLGLGDKGRRSFRHAKLYQRRRRWLS